MSHAQRYSGLVRSLMKLPGMCLLVLISPSDVMYIRLSQPLPQGWEWWRWQYSPWSCLCHGPTWYSGRGIRLTHTTETRHGKGVLLPKERELGAYPGGSIINVYAPNNRASKCMIELVEQERQTNPVSWKVHCFVFFFSSALESWNIINFLPHP